MSPLHYSEISIRCSKQLRGSLNRILSKDYDEEVFGEMCAIKRIPDNQAKQKLAVNMREIVNVYRFVDSVERIISVKYSSENDKHEEKLMEIWRNLKPYQKLEGRISTQWSRFGVIQLRLGSRTRIQPRILEEPGLWGSTISTTTP